MIFSTPTNMNEQSFEANGNDSSTKKFTNSDEKRGINRFRRIKEEDVSIDDRLRDNSFDAKQKFISFARDVDYTEVQPNADWKCLICHTLNAVKRKSCSHCKTVKGLASSQRLLKESWACLDCDFLNFNWNKKCGGCQKENPDYSSLVLQGNWECPSCENLNFANRKECFRCKKPKHDQWICEGCSMSNFNHRIRCLKCKERRKGWKCTACEHSNSTRKFKCSKCQKDGPFKSATCGDISNEAPPSRPRSRSQRKVINLPGDWRCSKCKLNNFARNLKCHKCLELKPTQ